MLVAEEVRAAFLRKLKDSAINEKDIKLLGYKAFTLQEVAAKLPGVTQPAAGFIIPYYDLDRTYTNFFRFRYLEQPPRNGISALTECKEKRYTQPPQLSPQVYFPPIFDWVDLVKRDVKEIYITEGELKAACACKLGIPTVALGGVWNFMSKKEGIVLLPEFEALRLEGCVVHIVYDSDALSNPQVLLAENVLARRLLRLGAIPKVIRLISKQKDKKVGLDDFLVAHGKEAFAKLVEKSEVWEEARALHELNEEVIFLRADSNVLEPAERLRWRTTDFINSVYATRTYSVVEKKGDKEVIVQKSTAAAWVKWPGRAEVERVTYVPGGGLIINREYNLWRGWGMPLNQLKAGTVKLWHELMNYLFKGPDAEHRAWFERWLAYPLQHPGVKLSTATMMWGTLQGTGKTLVGHTLECIYGDNFSEIGPHQLGADHNEWALCKQFVLGDEITGADSNGRRLVSMDTLKGLVTQKKLYMNPKFIGGYFVPDCINYYFTSNHPDTLHMEDTDRRFAIFEVRGDTPLSDDFYKAYNDWYKSPAVGALFYYLLNLPLNGFNPYARAPETLAKEAMLADARSDVGSWVAALRADPDSVLKTPQLGANGMKSWRMFTTTELHRLYDPEGTGRVTVNGLARELKRARFKKILDGAPLGTPDGLVKLWAIRNKEALLKLKSPKAFTKAYCEDRKHEKV